MSLPLIGITTTRSVKSADSPTYRVNKPYKESITAAGGTYELIPMNLTAEDLDALLLHLDGILFTGGSDVDPKYYGGQPHPKVGRIDPDRDRAEIHLVHQVVNHGMPFLGICRGIQVLNIALGGTLHEDLPGQFPSHIQHDNHGIRRDFLAHTVRLEPASSLAKILGDQNAPVNSLHHQGLRQVAPGLRPTAYSPDSLVEAVELEAHPFGLAVQWHPEELQSYEGMRQLFKTFIQSCQPHRLA